jgi:hypothetical protein
MYSWSPATGLNNTSGSNVVASPTSSITYTLSGVANGCTKSVFVPVTVSAAPQMTSSANATVCDGSSVALTVSGAAAYAWSPASGLNNTTGANVNAAPTASTTYTITGTQNGCTGTKTIAVTVTPLPNITAPSTQNICTGSSAALTAGGATTYAWTPATGLNATTGTTVVAMPPSSVT